MSTSVATLAVSESSGSDVVDDKGDERVAMAMVMMKAGSDALRSCSRALCARPWLFSDQAVRNPALGAPWSAAAQLGAVALPLPYARAPRSAGPQRACLWKWRLRGGGV